MSLTLPEFVATWQKSMLTERSAAQSHFNGLCEILGEPKPAYADPEGATYSFERGASKVDGTQGWADVWKREYFGWEYKGKRKDLDDAYKQLLQYREDLENPPLLITCDLNRFEVHTNFTNTAPRVYKFDLAALEKNEPTPECPIPPMQVLRWTFTDPGKLKPGLTTEQVTEAAAAKFSELAKSLRDRGVDPEKGAHFLMRLLFCLFSEDIGLLPGKLFSKLVNQSLSKPSDFDKKLKQLFAAMSQPGGTFGADDIAYFNGGLFSDDQTYPLAPNDIAILSKAAALDWGHVEPAIFGTLFERSLDPNKRSQLGAHYTSKDDIMLIVEPVVMAPLRRRWEEVKKQAEALAEKVKSGPPATRTKSKSKMRELLMGFADEVSKVTVLDPACGSGNFLYVALKSLLDLEKQISSFAANNGLSGLLPRTDPSRLFGIETNVYAHELASVVVWIGYIQWQHDNGFNFGDSPILKPLTNIKRMDAVLAYDKEGEPVEPEWPKADFIIGNPPYVGGNRIRQELGGDYVDNLLALYRGRLHGFSDYVCYWFEKARLMVEKKLTSRVGLLGTQGIRGGVNREVLERIKETGDIFMAWSDRDWLLDGATVHVSFVGFDNGSEQQRYLDDQAVQRINANLTADVDTTTAQRLSENAGLWAYGSQQKGKFDITPAIAKELLSAVPTFGKRNSDVVKKSINGKQLLQANKETWVIDFGESMSGDEAALYEAPFEYVRKVVYPKRKNHAETIQRTRWWLHARPSPKYRNILRTQRRYIATPGVSKHRVFVWLDNGILVDHAIIVFAFEDDYTFGVLHSRIHELWTRTQATQVRDAESACRYTPQSTFETFPFPWAPGQEPKDDPRVQAIGAAVKELVEKRDAWLNPPGVSDADLKKRTLTNLYNQRPQWLDNLHRALDAAVFAAYGWPASLSDTEILERLLALNHERAANQNSAAKGATN